MPSNPKSGKVKLGRLSASKSLMLSSILPDIYILQLQYDFRTMIRSLSLFALSQVLASPRTKFPDEIDRNIYQADAKPCDAFITSDQILQGTCQTKEAFDSFMSLTPYVNPGVGHVCGEIEKMIPSLSYV